MKIQQFVVLCTTAFSLNSCEIINLKLSAPYFNQSADGTFDVVIVPGTPYDSAAVTPIYKARLLWAKHLFDEGIARNIIFSGAAAHNKFIEGQTMKMLADSIGIPPQHTFAEKQARHSIENVTMGILLAQQLGFKKIAVATDPFQSCFLKHHLSDFAQPVSLLPFSIYDMPEYYHAVLPAIKVSGSCIDPLQPIEKQTVMSDNVY